MSRGEHPRLHCPFCQEVTRHVVNEPERRCLACGTLYEWADAGHPRELPICQPLTEAQLAAFRAPALAAAERTPGLGWRVERFSCGCRVDADVHSCPALHGLAVLKAGVHF